MNSINGGQVFNHELDGWSVFWESGSNYRHWCHQIKNPKWDSLLVVMFNPGSLSGDGANLSKDTTLRILREVCGAANLNPYVINLFDYASASPQKLFDNWEQRDSNSIVFGKLPLSIFQSYILAYGDYENWGQRDTEIKDRQALVLSYLESLNEILLPKNNSGSPKHPMIWQRQKLKPSISSFLKAAPN
ncbi:DUF1643 domain-containing protein [Alteromonas sp. MMG017]|uniref:DUF1643 domain-containing protein n=1 Tax=Alteromonas sp. MMG017 TaxID=2822692 RepID=UPI001B3A5F04|nr:DUF1643 domain-containing protein [Alteromonas sp. MMG017]MBQ4830606.1 DUF1643 domain-containing protein [Alteromonas sp. MMG017]